MFNIEDTQFYCISLNTEDGIRKYARTKNDFDKKTSFILNKFEGINGYDLKLPTNCTVNEGNYGCILSHIGLLKLAKKENIKYLAVFEDDVMIADDFQERLQALSLLNIDFDMFYLGGGFNAYTVNFKMTEHPNIANCLGVGGTHAYIIKNRIFDYVISHILFDRGIDGFYSSVICGEPNPFLPPLPYRRFKFDVKMFIPFAAAAYPDVSEVVKGSFMDNEHTKEWFINHL